MAKVAITEQQAENIFREEDEDFETVEEMDWIDDGKYADCDIVVRQISTGKFYILKIARSGSYFTDYDFFYPNFMVEVEKKEVMVTQWVPVK